MDMGIKGRKAIVCAASKGLGRGCAMALAQEGVDLVINARTKAEPMNPAPPVTTDVMLCTRTDPAALPGAAAGDRVPRRLLIPPLPAK